MCVKHNPKEQAQIPHRGIISGWTTSATKRRHTWIVSCRIWRLPSPASWKTHHVHNGCLSKGIRFVQNCFGIITYCMVQNPKVVLRVLCNAKVCYSVSKIPLRYPTVTLVTPVHIVLPLSHFCYDPLWTRLGLPSALHSRFPDTSFLCICLSYRWCMSHPSCPSFFDHNVWWIAQIATDSLFSR